MMLRIQGLPANLISMGAIDFGLLLEGTLVIVETVYVAMEKRLTNWEWQNSIA